MKCTRCGSKRLRVVNTRQDTDQSTIRQKICQGCGLVQMTVEVPIPTDAVKWKGKSMVRIEGYQNVEFMA